MVINIQRKSLLNILAAAKNGGNTLSEDDKKAVRVLEEQFCAEGADEMQLTDCAAYEIANMWGINDVWVSAMSGMYQTDFQELPKEEAEQVIDAAFEKIDWDEVENAAWKAGNSVISDAVNSVMAEKTGK